MIKFLDTHAPAWRIFTFSGLLPATAFIATLQVGAWVARLF